MQFLSIQKGPSLWIVMWCFCTLWSLSLAHRGGGGGPPDWAGGPPDHGRCSSRERDSSTCCAFDRKMVASTAKGIASNAHYTPSVYCPGNGWCALASQIAIPWTDILGITSWPTILPSDMSKFTLEYILDVYEKQLEQTLYVMERGQNSFNLHRDDYIRFTLGMQREIKLNGTVIVDADHWVNASIERATTTIQRFFKDSPAVPAISIVMADVSGGYSTFLVQLDGFTIDRRDPKAVLEGKSNCEWPLSYVEPNRVHEKQVILGSSAVQAGNTLFSSTILSESDELESIESQTRSIIRYMSRVLDKQAMHLGDIVDVKVMLRNKNDLERFDQVWREEMLRYGPLPARVTLVDAEIAIHTHGSQLPYLVTVDFIAHKSGKCCVDQNRVGNRHYNIDFYELLDESDRQSHAVKASDGTIFVSATMGTFGAENRGESNQEPLFIGNVSFDSLDPFAKKEYLFPGTDSTIEFVQTLTNIERITGRFGLDRKDFFWIVSWLQDLAADYQFGTQDGLTQFYNTSFVPSEPSHTDIGDSRFPYSGAKFMTEIFAYGDPERTEHGKSAIDQNESVQIIRKLLGTDQVPSRNYCAGGSTIGGCLFESDNHSKSSYIELP